MDKRILLPSIIFLVTLFIYIFFAGRFNFNFRANQFNYFSHQAFSFLNFKLSLISTSQTADLSTYKGKKYLYWGPTPTLLIIPFVFLFGVNIPDTLYTAILGAFSPLLIYLILLQLRKLNFIKIDDLRIFLISIFFGFGTTHFYQSILGGVWQTSQVISNLYILIALLIFYRYFTTKKYSYLLISSFFCSLAIWGRQTYIFYIPLFIAQLYLFTKKDFQVFKKNIFYFFIPLFFLIITSLTFNFLRFDSFLENGYQYQESRPHFKEDFIKYGGTVNVSYISRNFYYMFFHLPTIKSNFPYFKFDEMGNSVLVTSPFLLLVIFALRKKYISNTKGKYFVLPLVGCAFLIFLSLWMFWGTGWIQFGYRYLLDAMPILAILISMTIKKVSLKIILPLLIISIVMNTLGTMWILTN